MLGNQLYYSTPLQQNNVRLCSILNYFSTALTHLQVHATIVTDMAECLYDFSSNQVFIHNSLFLALLSMVSGGLVEEYFFSKKSPNIKGLFYVHLSPNIMGLFYVHKIP